MEVIPITIIPIRGVTIPIMELEVLHLFLHLK
jgi:hypothetical protein